MHPASGEITLAFDVGLKRTGVAVGSKQSGSAQPVTTLAGKNGQLDWQALDTVIANWQPTTAVVGDPKTSDPHLNKLIRRVVDYLQRQQIAVVRVDETLTSAHANSQLNTLDIPSTKKTELRDQIAACLILESYFRS